MISKISFITLLLIWSIQCFASQDNTNSKKEKELIKATGSIYYMHKFDRRNLLSNEYYMYFVSSKIKYAYPIKFENIKNFSKYNKYPSNIFRITATIKEVNLRLTEKTFKIAKLIINSIEQLPQKKIRKQILSKHLNYKSFTNNSKLISIKKFKLGAKFTAQNILPPN